MNSEAGLLFTLKTVNNRVEEIELQTHRPLHMVKLVHGRPVNEALELLGNIYRICSIAQRYAGLSALREIYFHEVPLTLEKAQSLLVNMESLREHLWQILIMWPKLSSIIPKEKVDDLPLLSLLLPELEKALFGDDAFSTKSKLQVDNARLQIVLLRLQKLCEQHVFAMPLNEWSNINTAADLLQWAQTHHSSAANMMQYVFTQHWQSVGLGPEKCKKPVIDSMPLFSRDSLLKKFSGKQREQFIYQPKWKKTCRETSAFTRQLRHPLVNDCIKHYGPGLLARFAARLVETHQLCINNIQGAERLFSCRSTVVSTSVNLRRSGQGLGIVEAARGRLIHWIDLYQDQVQDYAIVAPTEWNFHPKGIAMEGLRKLEAEHDSELRKKAALWINAIDPCVSFQLNITRH